ncbi:MAG: hypothetical protein FWC32_05280 [Firmicutes bacterium]|nr:hypothetical protein [Bacillota bacterium]
METPQKPKRIIEILLLICIVALVISNGRLNNRLTSLENSINHISIMQMQEGNSIRHQIWDVSNRVDTVSEQILQSTRLSFDEIALIQGYDGTTASADVQVSFYLREHNLGDTVGVTARGRVGDIHSTVASFTNGRFVADITLPVQDNFTLSFTSTGDTLTTGELMELNLADMLSHRFSYWLGQGSSSGHGPGGSFNTIMLNPEFRNDTQGNESLNVRTLSISLEFDGTEIKNWDLTPYLRSGGNGQVLQIEYWGMFQIDVDNDENIRPGEVLTARLVIYDNLGIRYQQLDSVFVPISHSVDRLGRATATAMAPVPAREVMFRYDRNESWGFIRMVE